MNLKIKSSQIPQLFEQLSSKGCRAIGVVLRVDVPLLKKSRITKQRHSLGDYVVKVSSMNAMVNFEYQDSVNRQREREDKEPNFKHKSNWFRHVGSRPVVALKGEDKPNYIQLKVNKVVESHYLTEEGDSIDKDAIKDLLPKTHKKSGQGLDNQIITIVPKLESFVQINAEGNTYQVEEK